MEWVLALRMCTTGMSNCKWPKIVCLTIYKNLELDPHKLHIIKQAMMMLTHMGGSMP